jgi:hypothetical protein
MQEDVPGREIPDTDISITTTTNQKVAPWHHCPDAHHVALKRLLVRSVHIENVNLGIVEGDDDVLFSEMQASHYSLVRCDLPRVDLASRAPRRFHHVPLLEV